MWVPQRERVGVGSTHQDRVPRPDAGSRDKQRGRACTGGHKYTLDLRLGHQKEVSSQAGTKRMSATLGLQFEG